MLRQMTPEVAAEPVHLFKPDPTVRTRRNPGFDTPFPPEVPHALNAPDGVIIYYSLASRPSGEVTIDVLDSAGAIVRHMSSVAGEPVKEAAKPPHPNWWVAPPFSIPAAAGLNRTNWDLRFDAPPAFTHTFEINANPGLTPASPEGILAPPGSYTIKINVDGKSFTQKATVTNDPRSPATNADVRAQAALLRRINDATKIAFNGYQQAEAMRAALKDRAPRDSTSESGKALATFRAKVDSIGGNIGGNGGPTGRKAPPNFYVRNGRLVAMINAQDNADQAPTEAMIEGYQVVCRELATAVSNWSALNAKDLPALNALLGKSGVQPLSAAAGVTSPDCGAKPAQSLPSARKR